MNTPTTFAKARTPDEMLNDWTEAKKELAAAQKKEKELREQILLGAFNFDTNAKDDRSGVENFELNGGYKLKASFGLTYKLADNEKVSKALTKLENMGAEGVFIAGRIVRWKPELSVTEFKNLSTPMLRVMESVLTITPKLPSLELVEPKA